MTDGLAGAASAALVWVTLLLALLTVALFVLSALIERSGPIRMRHWTEESGGVLRALYDRPARFEAFRYLLNLASKSLPAALCLALAVSLAGLLRPLAAAAAAFLAVALLAAVTERANRALVGRWAEETLRRLTWAYRACLFLLTPLIVVVAPLLPGEKAPSGEEEDEEEDEASDEEIEAFIDVGTREGILEPAEGDLLWNIVDFADTQAKSVMTPRIDMISAPIDASLDELATRFVESRHSRIPLYQDSPDHIAGVLHIRDLLSGLLTDPRPPARQLANLPFFVPETKHLDELLKELQSRSQQIAIVVDEYGGTAGLVTVEDLVEEIVGDIGDEHETAEPVREELPDGGWRLDGRTHLEELEELLDVEIGEQPYETLGGLVMGRLGYVPEAGETVEANGLRFTVERVSHRRVETVLVERRKAEGQPAGA